MRSWELIKSVLAQQGKDNNRSQGAREFARFSKVLQEFARISGGKFDSFRGWDLKEFRAMQVPAVSALNENVLRPLHRGSREISDETAMMKLFERNYSNAVVDWQCGRFQIRLQVRTETEIADQPVPPGPSVFDLSIRCVIQPRSLLSFGLWKREPFFQAGFPTGIIPQVPRWRFLDYMRPMVPQGFFKAIKDGPIFTYYCPFATAELDKKFVLRTSSVALGKAFVEHPEILTSLGTSCGLTWLAVGPYDGQFGGEDNVVRLAATVEHSLDQLQTLLTLVLRTLDLLDKFKLTD